LRLFHVPPHSSRGLGLAITVGNGTERISVLDVWMALFGLLNMSKTIYSSCVLSPNTVFVHLNPFADTVEIPALDAGSLDLGSPAYPTGTCCPLHRYYASLRLSPCQSRIASLVARSSMPFRPRLTPPCQTAVVSRTLAIPDPGLLASATCKTPPSSSVPEEAIPSTTTIHISGLSDAACILAPSGFEHLIAGMPSDFDTSLLAQL
jgi:hypothetical protein